MPITLGCPSCGKRFRARDESAGKKVKCPYCQAAVSVPAADESGAGAPPPPPPAPAFEPDLPVTRPAVPPRPAPAVRPKPPETPAPAVSSPEDWGSLPGHSAPTAPVPTAPSRPFAAAPPTLNLEPEPAPNPAPNAPRRERGDKPRPKPVVPAPATTAEPPPDEVLAKRWRSVRRGLLMVQFALFFVALVGAVGFGKAIYVRSVGELPKGEGWTHIEGYVNSGGPNSIPLSKTDEINLLTYGVLGGLAAFFLTVGRYASGGGPRNSGARGLFVLSSLLTLGAFIALLAVVVCEKVPFPGEIKYAWLGLEIAAPLAEFWFLTALTASGLALKRPTVARAVGFIGFWFALIAVLATVGLEQYLANARPKAPDADWLMYEQAGVFMGVLILVFAYWRAVGGVRRGAREFIQAVEDKE